VPILVSRASNGWSNLGQKVVKCWSNLLMVSVFSAAVQRLVPGTRWVDLETDRGKPAARLTGAVAAAAVAAQQAHQQHLQQQAAAAGALVGGSATAAAAAAGGSSSGDVPQQQQQQQQQEGGYTGRLPGPLDSINEQDHLADLEEYPLGSLMSFDSDTQDNVPEWIRAFAPAYDGVAAAAEAAEDAAAAAAMGLPLTQQQLLQQQQRMRLGQTDTMPDSSKLDAIESGLYRRGTIQALLQCYA
jgi:hypothetical protein